MDYNVIQNLFDFEVGAETTYNKELLKDQKEVEKVLFKFKTNQKLNRNEKKILQEETKRILVETPADEELPILYGRKFSPIGYSVANSIVTTLNLQGTRNKQGRKRPFILDAHKLQTDLFDKAKEKTSYNYPLGARGYEIVDMREAFLERHEFNEFFDCYFLETASGSPYRAWFHKDYKGIVRYYTVNPYEENLSRYSFDAIDLYGAALAGGKVLDHDNKKYLRHESYAIIREQQHVLEKAFVHDERDRLDRVERQLTKRVSQLGEKNAKTMHAVLKTLIKEAKRRTFQEGYFTNDDRTLFFMSTNELVRRVKENYLMDKEVKKSKTTLNNAVNLLSALGFIEKMTDRDLYNHTNDVRLIDDRHEYARKEYKNPISYYVINDLPSEYWVNKQVEKMFKKRLTLHNVTEKRFKRAFGPEMTQEIFVNKENTRKKDKYINEKNEYVRLFLLEIRKNGFVTKDTMDDIHNIPSQNVANKLWTELTSELNGFRIVRTNAKVRELLDIDTIGSVFISNALAHPNTPTFLPLESVVAELKNALIMEYEELVDEVLTWYGDIFKVHKVPKRQSVNDNLFKSITVEDLKRMSTTQNVD